MTEKTINILRDLETVRENLLALSDDIWHSIDHNDSDALEAGVEFKRQYNSRLSAFDTLSSEISQLVQQFTSINLAADEESGEQDDAHNERIIQQLNREQPHSIDEDFTFRRPHGYILDGKATTGITTWRRLYELLCAQLLRRNRDLFYSLPENDEFISNRGHHQFARSPDGLRSASQLDNDLFTEINLSANALRDVIRRLLAAYDIPTANLQVFLREDRDAERER